MAGRGGSLLLGGGAVAGAALVVIGIVLMLTAPPVSFGWFAYQPLPQTVPYIGQTEIGGALVALGVCLQIGAVALWAFVRSRRATGQGQTPAQ